LNFFIFYYSFEAGSDARLYAIMIRDFDFHDGKKCILLKYDIYHAFMCHKKNVLRLVAHYRYSTIPIFIYMAKRFNTVAIYTRYLRTYGFISLSTNMLPGYTCFSCCFLHLYYFINRSYRLTMHEGNKIIQCVYAVESPFKEM